MFRIDRWIEIWASITSNKLRTFLSGFSIALALFVFIALFGLSKGLQNGFKKEFFTADTQLISIFARRTTKEYKGKGAGRTIQFEMEDYQFIVDNYKEGLKAIVPNLSKGFTARYGNEFGNYTIIGTSVDKIIINDNKIIKGRYLHKSDAINRRKNIVIGRLVEKDLFKNTSAIGKHLQLGETLYKVVGVFSDEDGDDQERLLYIPIETIQLIYGTKDVSSIEILPKDDTSLAEIGRISDELEKTLKQKHIIHPKDNRAIRVRNAVEGMKTTEMFFIVFKFLVLFIGAGSLIAGIVGIGNIMVYSVKERTKEIGIRKALGAQPSDIIGLILQEAMLITFIFGFIGIITAILLIDNLEDSLKIYLIYNPSVEKSIIIMATVILVISGLLAGFTPAYRAAKIKPIDALRDE